MCATLQHVAGMCCTWPKLYHDHGIMVADPDPHRHRQPPHMQPALRRHRCFRALCFGHSTADAGLRCNDTHDNFSFLLSLHNMQVSLLMPDRSPVLCEAQEHTLSAASSHMAVRAQPRRHAHGQLRQRPSPCSCASPTRESTSKRQIRFEFIYKKLRWSDRLFPTVLRITRIHRTLILIAISTNAISINRNMSHPFSACAKMRQHELREQCSIMACCSSDLTKIRYTSLANYTAKITMLNMAGCHAWNPHIKFPQYQYQWTSSSLLAPGQCLVPDLRLVPAQNAKSIPQQSAIVDINDVHPWCAIQADGRL